jgi:signal transduction histidine kinase
MTKCSLGLYLVKSLVEGNNGRVWVEDRVPGDHMKGARFVVMLPVA